MIDEIYENDSYFDETMIDKINRIYEKNIDKIKKENKPEIEFDKIEKKYKTDIDDDIDDDIDKID